MHIPDGFLSPEAAVALLGVAAGFFVHALGRLKQKLMVKEKKAALVTAEGLEVAGRVGQRLTRYGREKIWKMVSVVALVFVMQMIDISIAGAPVHVLGGVLAAILLGPLEGFVVIAVVLVIQAVALADGGLSALGANIINMGLIGSVGGYYLYKWIKERSKITWLAVIVATWLSVVATAMVYTMELAIFDTIRLNIVAAHVVFGLAEALVTLTIVRLAKHWK